MISSDTRALLAYSFLKGVGKKFLSDLASEAERSGQDIPSCFRTFKVQKKNVTEELIEQAFQQADEQVNIAVSKDHYIISKMDNDYPDTLKVIPDAPPILFCAGNLTLLKKPIITVIGTREPTGHGEIIASRVTSWFTQKGWVIASGLAKGIDTIAHTSCLNNDGETISVLAHGLEKIYPAENKGLASKITDKKGLLITEYKYNSYVGKANFVERDRIQAAIAKAVVLVQSDVTGGSLHASRASIEYGRYLIFLGQSKTDISNQETKIGANSLLINGSDAEKCKLLKTHKEGLRQVLYLSDKKCLDEIHELIKQLSIKPPGSAGKTLNLL
ncbi:DNA-processing protein DprA [Photobacterium sanguinicancri]|uniref:DNA-processing protein DprA n=1 Tax=Photobacterium sanguinicancri TaxID=875932 RepID=UPI0026E1D529|nr:DNA-processing protein DprA [Photobacterium sanguinicancri]MDO6497333.1 DNA-processing protein DprA [Photobacterium sanguinicancri]